jgi:hypothetical protein
MQLAYWQQLFDHESFTYGLLCASFAPLAPYPSTYKRGCVDFRAAWQASTAIYALYHVASFWLTQPAASMPVMIRGYVDRLKPHLTRFVHNQDHWMNQAIKLELLHGVLLVGVYFLYLFCRVRAWIDGA